MSSVERRCDGRRRTLVRRLNALMAERAQREAAAGGWLTRTDPAWRADWRRRMERLLAEVRRAG